MRIKQKIELLRTKPYKLTCLEGDYSASFATKEEAYSAKIRHQNKYPTHEMVITFTIISED